MTIMVWWLILSFLVPYTCLMHVTWGHSRRDFVVHCVPVSDIGVWKADDDWTLESWVDWVLIHFMGWSLEQVCQNYPAALELELLVFNVLRIFVLVAGAHELVPVCTNAGCGWFFVFGTCRDDAAVSNIVARFLSAARWSELTDVVNSGKCCLRAFTY